MNKILLVGLFKDKNLGDPIIGESVEYLYCKIRPDDSITRINLDEIEKHNNIFIRVLVKFHLKFNMSPSLIINKLYEKYFTSFVQNSNLVIVAGGGLIKFEAQYFYGLRALLNICKQFNVPMAINSVGVEGYDERNKKCQSLKNALQIDSLKYLSTRDDIGLLIKSYYDGTPTVFCEKVADPAVWIAEKYGIKRKSNSCVIGIGIGNFNLFSRYGSKLSYNYIKVIYIQVIKKLIEENEIVELFTNGLSDDNKCLLEIVEMFNEFGINLKYHIPSNNESLVKIISGFKGIIASRMHSCIIAYSLDVPAVGLVWNKKLSLFGQNIGAGEYFIEPESMNPVEIVDRLKDSVINGYDERIRRDFRQTILTGISNIANLIS